MASAPTAAKPAAAAGLPEGRQRRLEEGPPARPCRSPAAQARQQHLRPRPDPAGGRLPQRPGDHRRQRPAAEPGRPARCRGRPEPAAGAEEPGGRFRARRRCRLSRRAGAAARGEVRRERQGDQEPAGLARRGGHRDRGQRRDRRLHQFGRCAAWHRGRAAAGLRQVRLRLAQGRRQEPPAAAQAAGVAAGERSPPQGRQPQRPGNHRRQPDAEEPGQPGGRQGQPEEAGRRLRARCQCRLPRVEGDRLHKERRRQGPAHHEEERRQRPGQRPGRRLLVLEERRPRDRQPRHRGRTPEGLRQGRLQDAEGHRRQECRRADLAPEQRCHPRCREGRRRRCVQARQGLLHHRQDRCRRGRQDRRADEVE